MCNDRHIRVVELGLELGHLRRAMTKAFRTTRHEPEARVMPCLGTRHDGLYGPTHILGRAWAGTSRKWHEYEFIVLQCNYFVFNLLSHF